MFDFFSDVLGYIHLFANYFVNFLESLMLFINVVGDSIGMPIFMAGFMPALLGSCIMIVVGLGVIKFLIGR